MTLALLAAIAMFIQDTIGVLEVQAEAKNKGWIAGFCNAGKWAVAITCTTISVKVLQGHDTNEQLWVVALVMAANVFGSKTGQVIGQHYFDTKPPHHKKRRKHN